MMGRTEREKGKEGELSRTVVRLRAAMRQRLGCSKFSFKSAQLA